MVRKGRRDLFFGDHQHGMCWIKPWVRAFATQHFPKQCAEHKNIASEVERAFLALFGRKVRQRAHGRLLRIVLNFDGDLEVDEADATDLLGEDSGGGKV